jgi:four helix bundle protein
MRFENKKKCQDIEERKFNFAVWGIKIVNQLPSFPATFLLGRQVIDSATSINSNIVQVEWRF